MKDHQHSKRRRQQRRRCRLPDTSFAAALLFAATALSTTKATTTATEVNKEEVDEPEITTTLNSIIATYGPDLYLTRSDLLHPQNLDYTKFTRINYTSFTLNDVGKIWERNSNIDPLVLFGPYDWNPDKSNQDVNTYCHKSSPENQLPQCAHHYYERGLIGLCHMNGVQVFASVGVTYEMRETEVKEMAEVFGKVAASVQGRQEFAEQCAWLITNYNFDGIDIVWKYPKTSEDMTNYGMLLQAIRQELNELEALHGNGAKYGLTASMPCGTAIDYNLGHQIPNFDNVLTEMNLDTMNFHGKSKTAGFNAPLYTRTDDVDYTSVNGCVLQYLQNGASRSKINVGLPFYGHSYRDAVEIGDECTSDWLGECSDTVTWQEDRGSPRYHNIYDLLPTMPLYWDEETLTPLAFNDFGIVSYDDPKSICFKTEYTMMNQLNGVLVQELGADMLLDNSTPLMDAVNFKALNVNVDCDGVEFEALFQWREVSSSSSYTSTTTGINGYSSGGDEAAAAETEGETTTIHVDLDASKSTFRYTCGFGEGDAKERCSDPGWDDMSCETGSCPENGMLCFVVECIKPKNYALSGAKESHAEIWVKSEPKPIPHRKPEKVMGKTITKVVEAASDEETVNTAINTTENRVRACGSDYYDAAGNCGALCPNGHSDCPSGEFCWHVECGATPPTTTTTTTPYSGPMLNRYQCGFDRAEALTCQEECNGWTCGDGKDCYLVPCPS